MQPKQNIVKYALAALFIICLLICGIWYQSYQKSQSKLLLISSQDTVEDITTETSAVPSSGIVIYIHGEVINPGVYTLNEGDRIHDALLLAGGATDQADLERVNLAQILKDEDQIAIPSLLDAEGNQAEKAASIDDGLVNINTASLAELKSLPGVGDTIANYIIRYREDNGEFSTIEEIKNVDRIGEKTYENLKAYIKVK